VTPAVLEAAQNARRTLLLAAVKSENSPFKGKKPDELEFVDGMVRLKGQTQSAVSMAEILRAAKISSVSGAGKSQGTLGEAIHAQAGDLRLPRVVTVIDAGRIMNPSPTPRTPRALSL
jgi:xanthine dehydrogenase YagR molybdenum-binding subunit